MFNKGIGIVSTLSAALLFSGVATAQSISIASNPQGSVTYAAAAAIAKVGKKSGLEVTVVPLGGDSSILPAVNAGEYQFNIANIVSSTYGYRGKRMFKKPLANLRVAAIIFRLRASILVRASSDIRSIADLKGKRVSGGFTKAKAFLAFTVAALATGGISYKDVQVVRVQTAPQAIRDFIAGKVDATLFTTTSGLVRQAHASVGGIRFLPIVDNARTRAAFDKIVPGTVVENVKPHKRFPGISAPHTPVLSSAFVLLTSERTPASVVYKLTKLLATSKKELTGMHPAFRGFVTKRMAEKGPVPFHAGAVKYYREVGLLK